jgi:hypothetical protein
MSWRSRVRGRYNASELYFINHGTGKLKTTPEKWMNAPEKEIKELLTMWSGIGMHSQIQGLLGKENSEKKKEFVYKDIVLVGIADFIPPSPADEVWEIKTSEKAMAEAKVWHKHQARLYTTMFNRSKGIIYQPVQDDKGVYLKNLGEVKRDDSWFERELQKLYEFHLEVEELWKRGT